MNFLSRLRAAAVGAVALMGVAALTTSNAEAASAAANATVEILPAIHISITSDANGFNVTVDGANSSNVTVDGANSSSVTVDYE